MSHSGSNSLRAADHPCAALALHQQQPHPPSGRVLGSDLALVIAPTPQTAAQEQVQG